MPRLTVELPNSLHAQVKALAESEGVSVNQYVCYALAWQVAQMDETRPDAPSAYQALVDDLHEGAPDDLDAALDAREPTEPDPGPTAEVVARFRRCLLEDRARRRARDAQ